MLRCSTDDDSDCDTFAHQSKYWNKGETYTNEEIFGIKCSKPSNNKKRNGERRLPTRKPDPSVYNRNALLARENRRKKKMYLEAIEKELDVIRKANHALSKALRRQLEMAERLEKEKQYYEDIVKNRFKSLGFTNAPNFHHDIQRAKENLPAVSNEENDMFNTIMDIPRSRNSSPNDSDNLSTPSDDLYDSPDITLPIASTTWDDIWGDKDNVDNFINSNLTLQIGAGMQNLIADHCYANGTLRNINSEQERVPCDFIDVEAICSCNGTICANCRLFPTFHTPPIQLLNKQSS